MKHALRASMAMLALGCATASWAGMPVPAPLQSLRPASVSVYGAKVVLREDMAARIKKFSAEKETRSRARRAGNGLFFLGTALILVGLAFRIADPGDPGNPRVPVLPAGRPI